MKPSLLLVLALAAPFAADYLKDNAHAQNQLTVTAANKLKTPRPNETIELSASDLASLGEKDLMKLHVRDSSGKEILCQAVDTDYDDYHKPDLLIFQADFAPSETKT